MACDATPAAAASHIASQPRTPTSFSLHGCSRCWLQTPKTQLMTGHYLPPREGEESRRIFLYHDKIYLIPP